MANKYCIVLYISVLILRYIVLHDLTQLFNFDPCRVKQREMDLMTVKRMMAWMIEMKKMKLRMKAKKFLWI